MRKKVINALLDMGMPADIKGFRYITEIMCLYEESEKLVDGSLMKVYEAIAVQNETTVSRVERAIRHAFSMVLQNENSELVKKYFSTSHKNNGALLATLYYRLKMEV